MGERGSRCCFGSRHDHSRNCQSKREGREAVEIATDATSSIKINADELSPTQKFELAKKEILNRDRRHARQLYTSIVAMVVSATVALGLALIAGRESPSPATVEARCREYKDSLFIGCICGKCEGVTMKDVRVSGCTITINGTKYENQNSDEWLAQCVRSGGPEKWSSAH